MNQRAKGIVRAVAAALVVTFITQDVLWANPNALGAIRLSPSGIQAPPIPVSVATVSGSHAAHIGKTLYLIQDAHTNESAQLNIAKTLDILVRKEGITHVFMEAGWGDASLSFLRNKASLDHRKKSARSFLRKGILSGAEYLDLTSRHDLVLWGVENEELYWKSIEAYRKVAKDRGDFENYLKLAEQTVQALKPRIFNPSLRLFDAKRESFLNSGSVFTEYFAELSAQAEKRGIELSYLPHLAVLLNVLEREKAVDFEQANGEQLAAMQALSPEDLELLSAASREKGHAPVRVSRTEQKEEMGFYALLRDKVKDLSVYPELSKYLDYLDEAGKINAGKLLEEQKILEGRIYAALVKTEDEAKLCRASDTLRNLKGLFALTLTPDEYASLKADPSAFDIAALTGSLNLKIMEMGSLYERAVFLKGGSEGYIRAAKAFYELTAQRDHEFLKNTLEKMEKEGLNKAVLIAGGYHAPNLTSLLKDHHISYVSLTPQVLRETNQKRYETLLLSQEPARESAAGEPNADKIGIRLVRFNPSSFQLVTGELEGASLALAGARLAGAEKPKERKVPLWQGSYRFLAKVFLVCTLFLSGCVSQAGRFSGAEQGRAPVVKREPMSTAEKIILMAVVAGGSAALAHHSKDDNLAGVLAFDVLGSALISGVGAHLNGQDEVDAALWGATGGLLMFSGKEIMSHNIDHDGYGFLAKGIHSLGVSVRDNVMRGDGPFDRYEVDFGPLLLGFNFIDDRPLVDVSLLPLPLFELSDQVLVKRNSIDWEATSKIGAFAFRDRVLEDSRGEAIGQTFGNIVEVDRALLTMDKAYRLSVLMHEGMHALQYSEVSAFGYPLDRLAHEELEGYLPSWIRLDRDAATWFFYIEMWAEKNLFKREHDDRLIEREPELWQDKTEKRLRLGGARLAENIDLGRRFFLQAASLAGVAGVGLAAGFMAGCGNDWDKDLPVPLDQIPLPDIPASSIIRSVRNVDNNPIFIIDVNPTDIAAIPDGGSLEFKFTVNNSTYRYGNVPKASLLKNNLVYMDLNDMPGGGSAFAASWRIEVRSRKDTYPYIQHSALADTGLTVSTGTYVPPPLAAFSPSVITGIQNPASSEIFDVLFDQTEIDTKVPAGGLVKLKFQHYPSRYDHVVYIPLQDVAANGYRHTVDLKEAYFHNTLLAQPGPFIVSAAPLGQNEDFAYDTDTGRVVQVNTFPSDHELAPPAGNFIQTVINVNEDAVWFAQADPAQVAGMPAGAKLLLHLLMPSNITADVVRVSASEILPNGRIPVDLVHTGFFAFGSRHLMMSYENLAASGAGRSFAVFSGQTSPFTTLSSATLGGLLPSAVTSAQNPGFTSIVDLVLDQTEIEAKIGPADYLKLEFRERFGRATKVFHVSRQTLAQRGYTYQVNLSEGISYGSQVDPLGSYDLYVSQIDLNENYSGPVNTGRSVGVSSFVSGARLAADLPDDDLRTGLNVSVDMLNDFYSSPAGTSDTQLTSWSEKVSHDFAFQMIDLVAVVKKPRAGETNEIEKALRKVNRTLKPHGVRIQFKPTEAKPFSVVGARPISGSQGARLASAAEIKLFKEALAKEAQLAKFSDALTEAQLAKLLDLKDPDQKAIEISLGGIHSTRNERRSIAQIISRLKASSVQPMTRRAFNWKIAAWAGGAAVSGVLAAFFVGKRYEEASEGDFWLNFDSAATPESAKKLIRSIVRWLEANGDPDTAVVREYLELMERKDGVQWEPTMPAIAGKAQDPDTGAVKILINPVRLHNVISHLKQARSRSLFIENLAGIVVREAWGVKLQKSYAQDNKRQIHEGSAIHDEMLRLRSSKSEQAAFDHLYEKRNDVTRLAAESLAWENFELTQEIGFLRWAEKAGLYSEREAQEGAVRLTDPVFAREYQEVHALYRLREDPYALFRTEMGWLINVYFKNTRANQISRAELAWIQYLNVQFQLFQRTGGREGLDVNTAQHFLTGALPVTGAYFEKQIKDLFPDVDRYVRERLKALAPPKKSGARLASADDLRRAIRDEFPKLAGILKDGQLKSLMEAPELTKGKVKDILGDIASTKRERGRLIEIVKITKGPSAVKKSPFMSRRWFLLAGGLAVAAVIAEETVRRHAFSPDASKWFEKVSQDAVSKHRSWQAIPPGAMQSKLAAVEKNGKKMWILSEFHHDPLSQKLFIQFFKEQQKLDSIDPKEWLFIVESLEMRRDGLRQNDTGDPGEMAIQIAGKLGIPLVDPIPSMKDWETARLVLAEGPRGTVPLSEDDVYGIFSLGAAKQDARGTGVSIREALPISVDDSIKLWRQDPSAPFFDKNRIVAAALKSYREAQTDRANFERKTAQFRILLNGVQDRLTQQKLPGVLRAHPKARFIFVITGQDHAPDIIKAFQGARLALENVDRISAAVMTNEVTNEFLNLGIVFNAGAQAAMNGYFRGDLAVKDAVEKFVNETKMGRTDAVRLLISAKAAARSNLDSTGREYVGLFVDRLSVTEDPEDISREKRELRESFSRKGGYDPRNRVQISEMLNAVEEEVKLAGARLADQGAQAPREQNAFKRWLGKRMDGQLIEKLSTEQLDWLAQGYQTRMKAASKKALTLAIFMAGFAYLSDIPSAAAVTAIFAASALLHETGHWIVAKLVQWKGNLKGAKLRVLSELQPRVRLLKSHAFTLPVKQFILINAAGPVVNLLLALTGAATYFSAKDPKGLPASLMLWSAIVNGINFISNASPFADTSDGQNIKTALENLSVLNSARKHYSQIPPGDVPVEMQPFGSFSIRAGEKVYWIAPAHLEEGLRRDKNKERGEEVFNVPYFADHYGELQVPFMPRGVLLSSIEGQRSFEHRKGSYMVFEVIDFPREWLKQTAGARLASEAVPLKDKVPADEKSAATGKELGERLDPFIVGRVALVSPVGVSVNYEELRQVKQVIGERDGFVLLEISMRGPELARAALAEFKGSLADQDISQWTGEALIRSLYDRKALRFVPMSRVPDTFYASFLATGDKAFVLSTLGDILDRKTDLELIVVNGHADKVEELAAKVNGRSRITEALGLLLEPEKMYEIAVGKHPFENSEREAVIIRTAGARPISESRGSRLAEEDRAATLRNLEGLLAKLQAGGLDPAQERSMLEEVEQTMARISQIVSPSEIEEAASAMKQALARRGKTGFPSALSAYLFNAHEKCEVYFTKALEGAEGLEAARKTAHQIAKRVETALFYSHLVKSGKADVSYSTLCFAHPTTFHFELEERSLADEIHAYREVTDLLKGTPRPRDAVGALRALDHYRREKAYPLVSEDGYPNLKLRLWFLVSMEELERKLGDKLRREGANLKDLSVDTLMSFIYKMIRTRFPDLIFDASVPVERSAGCLNHLIEQVFLGSRISEANLSMSGIPGAVDFSFEPQAAGVGRILVTVPPSGHFEWDSEYIRELETAVSRLASDYLSSGARLAVEELRAAIDKELPKIAAALKPVQLAGLLEKKDLRPGDVKDILKDIPTTKHERREIVRIVRNISAPRTPTLTRRQFSWKALAILIGGAAVFLGWNIYQSNQKSALKSWFDQLAAENQQTLARVNPQGRKNLSTLDPISHPTTGQTMWILGDVHYDPKALDLSIDFFKKQLSAMADDPEEWLIISEGGRGVEEFMTAGKQKPVPDSRILAWHLSRRLHIPIEDPIRNMEDWAVVSHALEQMKKARPDIGEYEILGQLVMSRASTFGVKVQGMDPNSAIDQSTDAFIASWGRDPKAPTFDRNQLRMAARKAWTQQRDPRAGGMVNLIMGFVTSVQTQLAKEEIGQILAKHPKAKKIFVIAGQGHVEDVKEAFRQSGRTRSKGARLAAPADESASGGLAQVRSTHTRFGDDNAAEEVSLSAQKDIEYGIQLWRPLYDWRDRLPAMKNNTVWYAIYAGRHPNPDFGIHRSTSTHYGRVGLRFDAYGNFKKVTKWEIDPKAAERYPWLKDSLKPWLQSQEGRPFHKRNASLADSEPLFDRAIEDKIERALSEKNFKKKGLPSIRQIDAETAFQVLLALFTDRNRHKTLRANAAAAIGELGDAALFSVPILQEFLRDPEVSKEAYAAIKRILRMASGARLADGRPDDLQSMIRAAEIKLLKEAFVRDPELAKFSANLPDPKISQLLDLKDPDQISVQGILEGIPSTRDLRRKIAQQIKNVKTPSAPAVTRRRFTWEIAAVLLAGGAGATALLYNSFAGKKKSDAPKDDLWKDFRSEPTLPSARRALQLTAEWLAANGYPYLDADDYGAHTREDRNIRSENSLPVAYAKHQDFPGGPVTIIVNPSLVHQEFQEVQKAGSRSHFILNHAAKVVREARGFWLVRNVPDMVGTAGEDLAGLTQEFLNAGAQAGDEFLIKNKDRIHRLVAAFLAPEFFELTSRVQFTEWAEKAGLYSDEEMDKAYARHFKNWRMFTDLHYKESPVDLLAVEIPDLLGTNLQQVRDPASASGSSAAWLFYYLLETARFRKSGGKEGIDPQFPLAQVVQLAMQGRIQRNHFRNQALELYPLIREKVDGWHRQFQETKRRSGARLAEGKKGSPKQRGGETSHEKGAALLSRRNVIIASILGGSGLFFWGMYALRSGRSGGLAQPTTPLKDAMSGQDLIYERFNRAVEKVLARIQREGWIVENKDELIRIMQDLLTRGESRRIVREDKPVILRISEPPTPQVLINEKFFDMLSSEELESVLAHEIHHLLAVQIARTRLSIELERRAPKTLEMLRDEDSRLNLKRMVALDVRNEVEAYRSEFIYRARYAKELGHDSLQSYLFDLARRTRLPEMRPRYRDLANLVAGEKLDEDTLSLAMVRQTLSPGFLEMLAHTGALENNVSVFEAQQWFYSPKGREWLLSWLKEPKFFNPGARLAKKVISLRQGQSLDEPIEFGPRTVVKVGAKKLPLFAIRLKDERAGTFVLENVVPSDFARQYEVSLPSREFTVGDPLTVGRAEGYTDVLVRERQDPHHFGYAFSRFHFEIQFLEGNKVQIKDLLSARGTDVRVIDPVEAEATGAASPERGSPEHSVLRSATVAPYGRTKPETYGLISLMDVERASADHSVLFEHSKTLGDRQWEEIKLSAEQREKLERLPERLKIAEKRLPLLSAEFQKKAGRLNVYGQILAEKLFDKGTAYYYKKKGALKALLGLELIVVDLERMLEDPAKKPAVEDVLDDVLAEMQADQQNEIKTIEEAAGKELNAIEVAQQKEITQIGSALGKDVPDAEISVLRSPKPKEKRKELEGARLANGVVVRNDAIKFSLRVYDAKKEEGRIMLGDHRLKIEKNKQNGRLRIYGLGDEPVEVENYRENLAALRKNEKPTITLSMTDLRQELGQDVTAVDAALAEIDTTIPVVVEVDLAAFRGENSEELSFPLLIREFNIARKQNAVILIKGERGEIEEVLSRAESYYPGRQNFILSREADIPEYYRNGKRIAIVSADDDAFPAVEGGRYFYVKPLGADGLHNLRAIFKTALFEARIEKLETSDPRFERFLHAYQILLGSREIADVSEFIGVLKGANKNLSTILKYAVQPKPIPLNALVRVYELMKRMAEQAA